MSDAPFAGRYRDLAIALVAMKEPRPGPSPPSIRADADPEAAAWMLLSILSARPWRAAVMPGPGRGLPRKQGRSGVYPESIMTASGRSGIRVGGQTGARCV